MHRIAGKYNPVRLLFMLGYVAFTCPCGTVYYKDEETIMREDIVKHEQVHLDQIERLGKFQFSWQYIYHLFRHGYKNNPFEIEARKGEA